MELHYGKSTVTMNFDNLIHVADEARNLDCDLNAITSFSFESLLGKMRSF